MTGHYDQRVGPGRLAAGSEQRVPVRAPGGGGLSAVGRSLRRRGGTGADGGSRTAPHGTPRRSSRDPAPGKDSGKVAGQPAWIELSTSSRAARRAGSAAAITPNSAASTTITIS